MATVLAETPSDVAAPEPADPFRARRERLLEQIGGGVAVFCASPILIKSRDTELRYRPTSELFYLTGFDEPGTVAVLTPHDPAHRLTLFVRPRDPEREVWDGPRAGVEGARERFGADAAYTDDQLETRLKELLEPADAVWYALGSHDEMDWRIIRLARSWRQTRPRSGKAPWDVRDPGQLLDRMRLVKDDAEIEQIRRACRLSAQGHAAAMRAARPGVGEWELEAKLDATFRAGGADCGVAFATIVGSAANATTLHYVSNTRRVEDGELVLVDAGAEAGYYCGDITRTFPVSGRFTPAQRAVYDVVLAAEEAAIAAVAPGAPFTAIHEAARRVLVEGMVSLGLLQGEVDELIANEAFRRFFMHQTSHYLGLDVHDVGPYKGPDGEPTILEPGMVLTIEPGLYIPAGAEDVPEELRGIGIRIEDDVLVTDDGREVLTRDVPVAAEEVEALVGADCR
ncbi:MAG TPA: aminopeptidase P N-terminal domain-containing protein [Longimicrobium sp.]|nr:aminopeptidase P N-terminal domain-containing protein [Longimicrobium sp.]